MHRLGCWLLAPQQCEPFSDDLIFWIVTARSRLDELFFNLRFCEPAVGRVIFWIDFYTLDWIGKLGKEHYLDRMRTFYFVSICESRKRIANANSHSELFFYLSDQTQNEIFPKIDVATRKLVYARQKFLSISTLGPEKLLDTVKIIVNKGASSNYLLSLSWSFAIVRRFRHDPSLSRQPLSETKQKEALR